MRLLAPRSLQVVILLPCMPHALHLVGLACDVSSVSAGLQADTLLLIFTLAALAPADQATVLQNAFQVQSLFLDLRCSAQSGCGHETVLGSGLYCAEQALRPGGLLLVRDHGQYDITHLRWDAARYRIGILAQPGTACAHPNRRPCQHQCLATSCYGVLQDAA